MDVDQFDFDLPDAAIALRPVQPRDRARMLVVPRAGDFLDTMVSDLPAQLEPGDCLVFNNSRVLPVQLSGKRGAARIDVTLVERVEHNHWWSYVRNARRIRLDDVIDFAAGVSARAIARAEDGRILWSFLLDEPLEARLPDIGAMPLPPYIARRRAADGQDVQDYQTIYAVADGSVAAPTAGLHFTPALLQALAARGIGQCQVTLHVGPGTFLPVKVRDTADHVMHHEWAELSDAVAQQLNAVRARGRRIIAVGTTALRVLETAAQPDGSCSAFSGTTDIFITPGYRFRIIDGLLTNFHLPRSTLFMLVSALAGRQRMHAAYRHALATGYRFYSYGDTSLLWKADLPT